MTSKLKPEERHGRSASRETEAEVPAPYYLRTDDGARVELVAHARAAGRNNLPETSAREPNDVEAAVQREHERLHRDLVERARGELRGLAADFDRRSAQLPTPRDLQVVVKQSEAAMERDLAGDPEIETLRGNQQGARRDLRAFALERRLARDARYPASWTWPLGLVAAILVAEAVANMAFFAGTNDFGLAGGFLVAVVVSLVNVGTGLVAGYFAFRWRTHPQPRLRRLATLGAATYAVVVVLFNLVTAHYRDVGVGGSGSGLRVDELLRHPLALSFPSAVLFFVGLLASGLACRKGYALDDPMPGYGEVHRRFTAADAALARWQEALRQQVLGHAEGVPESCRAMVQTATGAMEELGEIVARAEHWLESYEVRRERIERWCQQYLRRYRSENEAVRTAPAPTYYSQYPILPSQVDDQPVREMRAGLQGAGGRLDALREEARRIALEQPARVAAARDRFEAFCRESLRRADAGRGDGSAPGPTGESPREGAA